MVLNKLKSRGFHAASLSTYDFSTLYTTLPHNLIKEKLIDIKLFILGGWGPELFCLLLGRPGFNCWFSVAPVFQ